MKKVNRRLNENKSPMVHGTDNYLFTTANEQNYIQTNLHIYTENC